MASLNDYLMQTQRFLRDQRQDLIDPGDMVAYINRARREVAMRAQCVRRLTPISGAVITASVTAGGSGYTNNPTITITAPDFPSGQGPFPGGDQATALAIVQSGSIAAVGIAYGGAGYWQPTATVTDSTGSGAEVSLAVSYVNETLQGKEVYPFSEVDLSQFPGVASIYTIRSVGLLFNNFRYVLGVYDFTTLNALIRQWSQQWQYVPAVCAQYGQGADGSFYMYPVPSQPFQMEWDCLCLPQDLTTNLSQEVIPDPWCDAVAYFAAHLCYMELQNFNAGKGYLDLFDKMLLRYSQYARPGGASNRYGRY